MWGDIADVISHTPTSLSVQEFRNFGIPNFAIVHRLAGDMVLLKTVTAVCTRRNGDISKPQN